MNEPIERAKQLTLEARRACSVAMQSLTPKERERCHHILNRVDDKLEDALERLERAIEALTVTPETCRMREHHGGLSACAWCGFDPLARASQPSKGSE